MASLTAISHLGYLLRYVSGRTRANAAIVVNHYSLSGIIIPLVELPVRLPFASWRLGMVCGVRSFNR